MRSLAILHRAATPNTCPVPCYPAQPRAATRHAAPHHVAPSRHALHGSAWSRAALSEPRHPAPPPCRPARPCAPHLPCRATGRIFCMCCLPSPAAHAAPSHPMPPSPITPYLPHHNQAKAVLFEVENLSKIETQLIRRVVGVTQLALRFVVDGSSGTVRRHTHKSYGIIYPRNNTVSIITA